LQQKYKFNIVILPFDIKKWEYDYEKIEYLFGCNHPDVVVLSHASNVCGFINPYFEIFSRAKKYKTKTVLDMCQTAGLVETDLSTEYVDYAIFDGHKTLYGPLGIAGVVGASFENFEPLIYGGTGIDSANSEMPNTIPTRFEAGSTNILAISGLNAALTWIKEVGVSNIRETENKNLRRLLDLLNQYSNIDIIAPGESEKFIGVVSCVFKGYSSDNIGNILSENNIAVRTGLHCSPLAHKTLGTFPAGTVRFSIGYFNDEEDFASLEKVLEYIDENS
jgi:selenocysteine lyase/cysteine desulfurase